MPRIRSIKPEFPQSESIGKLSRDARLLFIQLWTIVDDAGRTRAASRMLASLLYPYDDDARELIDGWLDELEATEHIRRYVIEGSTYLEIINWLKHQKIDHPSKSRLPEFSEEFAKPRETIATDLGPRTKDKDLGEDQEESRSLRSRASEDIRETISDDWPPDYRERFWSQYPRKVGKKSAFALLDGIRKRGEVEFGRLMAGVMKIPIGEPRFIPHPMTWLRQGRWDDETHVNGASNGKPSPSQRAFELAAQARELEIAAGVGRPPDDLGSDGNRGPPLGPIPDAA